MINNENEKGAISTLVLFTVLMMTAILMAVYVGVSSKTKSQLKSDIRLQEIYGAQANTIDSIYEEQAAKSSSGIKFSDGTKMNVGGSESLASAYSKTVDKTFFSSNEKNDWAWQLFYDDDKYIFLIASDYVPNSTLQAYGNDGYTSTQNGYLVKTDGRNKDYNAAFTDSSSFNTYVFANSKYTAGSASTAFSDNPLTSTYLKWVELNPTSTNINIKAVAFMMDTDKWSQYAGTKYANTFAIGGPTVEMFNKSWNAYPGHSSNQLGTYIMTQESKDQDWTTDGYKVWNEREKMWSTYGEQGDLSEDTDMWCIRENDKAEEYYLASPTMWFSDSLVSVIADSALYAGDVNSNNSGMVAFRPIVVIPKASL